MLSENEDYILATIARQMREADPGFARRLAAGQPRCRLAAAATTCGAALALGGSLFLLLPVIVVGAVILLVGLVRLPVMNTQPSLRD